MTWLVIKAHQFLWIWSSVEVTVNKNNKFLRDEVASNSLHEATWTIILEPTHIHNNLTGQQNNGQGYYTAVTVRGLHSGI